LWTKEETSTPRIEELLSKIKKLKREELIKLIGINILMLATIAFITLVWLYFEPQLVTTKIGIVLTVFGIIFYLIAYNSFISRFRKINENQSNSEFLNAMIRHKERQKFLQARMLQIYFITLTLGVCLYLYEIVIQLDFPWTILAYSTTLIWISFSWLYLRPRVIKKEQGKLDKIINKFENIIQQNKVNN
jgi:hypothetical protein